MSDIKKINCGANTLQIKKFDMKNLEDNTTITVISKRNTGKSFLTREILYHKRKIPTTIVVSKTEKLNRFYGNFVNDSFIYPDFEPSMLNKVFERQKLMSLDNEKRKELGKEPKEDKVIIVMDDCFGNKDWVKQECISELFFNGRHYHLSLVLLMQYALMIPPAFRSNMDYIILLADDIISNRRKYYEYYCGFLPSFEVFQQVFTELTKDFGALIVNNRSRSSNISDKLFWYKAKQTPEFMCGSEKLRKYHKKNYDPDYDKKVALFDPMSVLSRKKKSNLIVEKIK
jgi:hypothetical protein